MPIDSLILIDSPRSGGEDPDHIARLAQAEGSWPPILVDNLTMRVIDGFHRVAASRLRGMSEIEACLVTGSPETLFVLAVEANTRHGLPLSLPDRRAAASTILSSHPAWSDRAVAAATGLSAKTVSALRCASGDDPQLHARLGRDGRYRPSNTAVGRRLAAELLAQRPDASLREIASMTGISPGTVRDVRARVMRGDDPVPDRAKASRSKGSQTDTSQSQAKSRRGDFTGAYKDARAVLSTLVKDPALRMNDRCRDLLRWLHSRVVDANDGAQMVALAPDHCLERLYEYASRCSMNWALIAEALSRRMDSVMAVSTDHEASSVIANMIAVDRNTGR